MKRNPMLLADFYKLSHRKMYPQGTEVVYSTWTPRTSRLSNADYAVVFGVQAFIKKWLIDFFDQEFFGQDINILVADYKRFVRYTLGDPDPDTSHIEELWHFGYLPLEIRSLPEGSTVPIRVPYMTIHNTDEGRFFWLTNYIESLASCELWQASVSATIAHQYRTLLDAYALETVGDTSFVPFQGHDFSMRGMSSLGSAELSGMGHLLSFVGTDTIPAIQAAEEYYGADIENELVGTSIPATEHSIQCAYCDDEAYIKAVINDVHPSGLVSVVSDGYDFWDVIGRVLPSLKEQIMSRNGKVVIRPDSGDPVKIVCGDPDSLDALARKGAVECLWDVFGGTTTEKGYRLLDSHIGLIYGDSITIDRAREISGQLKTKGFASINCVYGIGSYTYQYNTRDTLGFALKSTLTIRNGQEIPIFKDPKTDSGMKKSQKGRVAVVQIDGKLQCVDGLGWRSPIDGDLLQTVYRNGKLLVDDTFENIRERLRNGALSE